jgi:SPASM domain peptide maturase of grasp-with-spasm system
MNQEYTTLNNNLLQVPLDKYFYVYAYCFITVGLNRISLLDTRLQKVYLFNIQANEIFQKLKKRRVGEILDSLNGEDKYNFIEFIYFLINNELGRYVNNIELFPDIEYAWDEPRIIKKALIDVRKKWHNFSNIFDQLNHLGCRYIEIRAYRYLNFYEIYNIARHLSNDSIRSLNIILPFFSFFDKTTKLDEIIEKIPRLILSFYNTPKEDKKYFEEKIKNNIFAKNNIFLSSISINGCDNCGKINVKYMKALSLEEYMENKLFNGCLNRQIGIDENGQIKNCPSMQYSYGNIDNVKLIDIVNNKDFIKTWHIKKDDIHVCNECELRSICIDCRAYIQDANDIFSKPLKCNYDLS